MSDIEYLMLFIIYWSAGWFITAIFTRSLEDSYLYNLILFIVWPFIIIISIVTFAIIVIINLYKKFIK